MQVRIEDVSPVEKKLIVEIPWQTVADRLGNAYRELGKGVALKGFRKGKAPRSVLEQIYAPRVQAEVMSELVRWSFVTANMEHKLGAVAQPRDVEVGPFKKGEPFSYSAIVEIKGQIEVQVYEDLPIERRRIAIAEVEVDKAIRQLLKEHTELEAIEGRTETALGDVVILSVVGTIGEHPINQPRFGVDLDDIEREPMPGLCAALTGIPIDTKDKLLEIDIPADHADETLRGRHASLRATIVEARKKLVPALDDDFAKETGKADTFEGLTAAVRKELEDREKLLVINETRHGALRELIKRNQIPVATSLVERAIEMQYGRFLRMMGMPADKEAPPPPPEFRDKMRPAGTDEVRGQLLLEAIADKANLTVGDDELMAHVAQKARERNIPPARLRAEWERNGRLDSARWSIRQDKVLDLLVGKATVTEVDKLSAPPESGLGDFLSTEPPDEVHDHVHGPDCDH